VCSVRGDARQLAPVYGVAVVDQQLFVVRAWSALIEVYDITTYCPLGQLSVARLVDVTDMTGCPLHHRLYVADSDSRAVHVLNLNDTAGQRHVVSLSDVTPQTAGQCHVVSPSETAHTAGQWSLVDKPYGVSVSSSGHVVISFSETSVVAIFSSAGVLQRQIVVDELLNVRHAVLLDTGQLVVCHGSLQHHAGVSVIDAQGQIVRTLRAPTDYWPTHLALDQRGFIYVADYSNKRVMQLQSDLTYMSDIVDQQHGLRNPRSICIDPASRRLYVAEAAGNVLVFGFH